MIAKRKGFPAIDGLKEAGGQTHEPMYDTGSEHTVWASWQVTAKAREKHPYIVVYKPRNLEMAWEKVEANRVAEVLMRRL